MTQRLLRGPILNPRPDGTVEFIPDGAILGNETIQFVGHWKEWEAGRGASDIPVTDANGLILPPFLDAHTHIPQYPIRGKFTDGIADDAPEGKLLAGLHRNVFPEEAKSADETYAEKVVEDFRQNTLAQGVVGGAAFMTVHANATRIALAKLSNFWSVGMVLMDQNCPTYLRTNAETWEADTRKLAADFGKRVIVTDRFAVSVSTPLRRRASKLAAELGLRMQTHLNEQRTEKAFVEDVLYPDYASYTDVYRQDGLLERDAILAHCIQMTPDEWRMVSDAGASIAHCPTSNLLLDSGTMPLDDVKNYALPYAICTDVGASPTTSLLAEMAQFLHVHAGISRFATPSEALWRVTLGASQILGLDTVLGSFDVGKPLSYVVADAFDFSPATADDAISGALLSMTSDADVNATADRLTGRISRVVLAGKTNWERQLPR